MSMSACLDSKLVLTANWKLLTGTKKRIGPLAFTAHRATSPSHCSRHCQQRQPIEHLRVDAQGRRFVRL